MTLRPGYYDANPPDYRGILREDSYGWYRCRHKGHTKDEAKACARAALPVIRALAEDEYLPSDWEVIPREPAS